MKLVGQQKLAAARRVAKLKLPYLARLIDRMAPIPVEGLGTFGITEHLALVYDPDVLDEWEPKTVAWVISHEALHPLMSHARRAKRAGVGPATHAAWNAAADACINEILREAWGWSPADCITPELLSQPRNLTTEERYALLLRACGKPSGGKQGSGGKASSNDGEDSGVLPDLSEVIDGNCGSGAGGRPLPGEPDASHPASRSAAEIDATVKQVAEATQEAESKRRGAVPGRLLRRVSELLKPPAVRWQDKLRRAARRAVEWKRGAVDYRFDGVARKQSAVGFGHGKPLLPRLRAPVVKAEVWVDTSGSMGSGSLERALSEAHEVLRSTGSRVRFMAIDARIHSELEVRNVQQMREALKGGGGTDFRPAFESLRKRRAKDRPSVVIFATDGFGPAPAEAPPRVHVIWLLIGRSRRPCAWGEFIEVQD